MTRAVRSGRHGVAGGSASQRAALRDGRSARPRHGWAFVAVADDATANYWNPAGLTDLFFSAVLDVQRTDTRLSPDPFLREGTRDGTTFVSTSAERALETYAGPGNVRDRERHRASCGTRRSRDGAGRDPGPRGYSGPGPTIRPTRSAGCGGRRSATSGWPGSTTGVGVFPRTAHTGDRARVPGSGPAAGWRCEGSGRRAARNELQSVSLLLEEISPRVTSRCRHFLSVIIFAT